MAQVLSPITHQPAEKIATIPVSLIIDHYLKETGLDVSSYFEGLKEICIYKCRETAYRFYYPFVPGDAAFYEALQKYDWYYADWKWDYDAAIPFIENGSKVLDIGCGYGNFLVKLKHDKKCDCTGLEFNDKAIRTASDKGLTIYKAFIEEYALDHKNEYDYVCFFQVLEHIADIDSFMKAAIACTKPGGKIIICVPNNNPFFYKYVEYTALNMPPHHMGIWNEEAFNGMAAVYPVKVFSIVKEKLYRYRLYARHYIDEITENKPLKRAVLKFFKVFVTAYFVIIRNKVDVGSILVVYKKSK